MSAATGLDHVAIVTGDLEATAADWQRLGFALTKCSVHTDGAGLPTGTGNVCAMLRHGYIEILAVIDPARPSATMQRFLAHHAGIHILSLTMADETAAHARLTQAGFAVTLARTERDGARFARLPLTDADPRLQLIRHLTPELVWQEELLHHPNHAAALEAVVVVDDPPAGFAARLSRAAGVAVMPDPAGGFILPLATGTVRVLSPEGVKTVFPDVVIPTSPFIAGVVVRTDDHGTAVAGLGVARPIASGWLAQTSGAAVLFTA